MVLIDAPLDHSTGLPVQGQSFLLVLRIAFSHHDAVARPNHYFKALVFPGRLGCLPDRTIRSRVFCSALTMVNARKPLSTANELVSGPGDLQRQQGPIQRIRLQQYTKTQKRRWRYPQRPVLMTSYPIRADREF